MKLFAFLDEHEGKKGNGQEPYTRNLFTIAAMLTIEENGAMTSFRERHHTTDIAQEAAEIVQNNFSATNSPGMVRLREVVGGREPAELELFLGVLRDTFIL